MSEQNNSGSGGSIVGFLLGGILGAAAGLLLAPRSGKETRKRLQNWLDDLEEKGEDLFDEGKDFIKEGKANLQKKAEKIKRIFESGN